MSKVSVYFNLIAVDTKKAPESLGLAHGGDEPVAKGAPNLIIEGMGEVSEDPMRRLAT